MDRALHFHDIRWTVRYKTVIKRRGIDPGNWLQSLTIRSMPTVGSDGRTKYCFKEELLSKEERPPEVEQLEPTAGLLDRLTGLASKRFLSEPLGISTCVVVALTGCQEMGKQIVRERLAILVKVQDRPGCSWSGG